MSNSTENISIKQKREYGYFSSPAFFNLPSCECGNENVKWSEYENYLYCPKCDKEYSHEGRSWSITPSMGEIFTNKINSIPERLEGAKRVHIKTGYTETMNKNWQYVPILDLTESAPDRDLFPIQLTDFFGMEKEEAIEGWLSLKNIKNTNLIPITNQNLKQLNYSVDIIIDNGELKNISILYQFFDGELIPSIISENAFAELKELLLLNELKQKLQTELKYKLNENKKIKI